MKKMQISYVKKVAYPEVDEKGRDGRHLKSNDYARVSRLDIELCQIIICIPVSDSHAFFRLG